MGIWRGDGGGVDLIGLMEDIPLTLLLNKTLSSNPKSLLSIVDRDILLLPRHTPFVIFHNLRLSTFDLL